MERPKSNELLETAKNAGFTAVAVLGWLGWIPTALIAIFFYLLLLVLVMPVVWSVVRFIGVDATVFLRQVVIAVAALIITLLNMVGVRVSINPKRLTLAEIPGMLFRSIFRLIRPNRFTFLFGWVTIAYVAVFELPALLRR